MGPQITTLAGFSLVQYIRNVKKAFETYFYSNDPNPIIKKDAIIFAPVAPYEATASTNNPQSERLDQNITPPAIIIDPYECKIDPSYDEYKRQGSNPHTNSGQLGLYLFVKALVLVTNNKGIQTHLQVRQLAFDIAGIITEESRFSSAVSMAQVTHVKALEQDHRHTNRLVGWTIQWQHEIEVPTPDYSNRDLRSAICNPIEMDADRVKELTIEECVDLTDIEKVLP